MLKCTTMGHDAADEASAPKRSIFGFSRYQAQNLINGADVLDCMDTLLPKTHTVTCVSRALTSTNSDTYHLMKFTTVQKMCISCSPFEWLTYLLVQLTAETRNHLGTGPKRTFPSIVLVALLLFLNSPRPTSLGSVKRTGRKLGF